MDLFNYCFCCLSNSCLVSTLMPFCPQSLSIKIMLIRVIRYTYVKFLLKNDFYISSFLFLNNFSKNRVFFTFEQLFKSNMGPSFFGTVSLFLFHNYFGLLKFLNRLVTFVRHLLRKCESAFKHPWVFILRWKNRFLFLWTRYKFVIWLLVQIWLRIKNTSILKRERICAFMLLIVQVRFRDFSAFVFVCWSWHHSLVESHCTLVLATRNVRTDFRRFIVKDLIP